MLARLLRGGAAICSESALVLNKIGGLNGFQSRFIGLNGHVISEIKTNDGWRIFDPDYGIEYGMSYDDLRKLNNDEIFNMLQEKLINGGYSKEQVMEYVHILTTYDDNVVSPIDTPLSPRLYTIEKIAEILKWVIPIIFLFLAGILFSSDTPHRKLTYDHDFYHW